MTKDDRDVLDILKAELNFIEQGGYGRSVREPWKATAVFQDSLSCINYADPKRSHPCEECFLTQFVTAERLSENVPCHFIPLNEAGETIEQLERGGDRERLEEAVKGWLRTSIQRIEAQRAAQSAA